MNKRLKIWIVVVLAFVVLNFVGATTSYNRAISFEETLSRTRSDIQIQQQRQFDLITKLVDTVEANSSYESETLQKIVEMRSLLDAGNIEEVQTLLNVVAEQYPQLKATESYQQLMTELSISANLISEHRKAYTSSIETYRKFVRGFPMSIYLNISGYETIDSQYLEFKNNELPSNLFGE